MNRLRTKVLWAKETELSSGRANERTQHAFYHLFILRSGDAIQYYGDQPYHLTDGHCLMVHPYVLHETPRKTHNLLSFYELKFEIYDAYLDKMVHEVSPHFKMTAFMETAMQYILAHWTRTDSQSQIDVDTMLSAMLLSICDHSFPEEWTSNCIDTSSYDQNVKQIIRHIERNFDEPFRLEHIADSLGLNANYMCTVFKKQTGHTIIDYLNYIRIRHCINAFYYGRDLIIDVALDAGFSSATHFNRIFKKYMGTTPTNYRLFFSSDIYVPTGDSPASPHLYEKNIELRIASSMDEAFELMRELGTIAESAAKTLGQEK